MTEKFSLTERDRNFLKEFLSKIRIIPSNEYIISGYILEKAGILLKLDNQEVIIRATKDYPRRIKKVYKERGVYQALIYGEPYFSVRDYLPLKCLYPKSKDINRYYHGLSMYEEIVYLSSLKSIQTFKDLIDLIGWDNFPVYRNKTADFVALILDINYVLGLDFVRKMN